MVKATGLQRPERGTIGKSASRRDYPISTYGSRPHIRVSSKHELKERLIDFINDVNREPVVHKWSYKIDDAASWS